MTPSGVRWGPTIASILVIVVCLAAADRFLARVESAEIGSTARQSYLTGTRLLAEGSPGKAVDFLRDAHALQRQNADYQLQLIAALTADGRTTDAEPLLTDVMQREPNDGPANLVAARLMVRKGNLAEAEAYFHRAIFGVWPSAASDHRISARMELIDLLAGRDRKQELLAELISLQAEAPESVEIQKRLGRLFLLAGAPARAADVYAALLQRNPPDPDAYEGMGEAELEQGKYSAAHEAFERASLHDPASASVQANLRTLDTVTSLDPTQRQLTSAAKYARSIAILDRARAALEQCGAKSDADRQLLDMATATVAAKAPLHVTNELAEDVLVLAERLWHAETNSCGEAPAGPDRNALELIMKKLSS